MTQPDPAVPARSGAPHAQVVSLAGILPGLKQQAQHGATAPMAPPETPAQVHREEPGQPLLFDSIVAAAHIGISRTCLYELQKDGTLIGVKVRGRRFWRRVDLDAYVAALARQPAT